MATTLTNETIESVISALPIQGRIMLRLLLLQYLDTTPEDVEFIATDRPDPRDNAEKEIISNAMEVKARGAYVIGIGPNNNSVFDDYLPTAKNGLLTPISSIVYAQLMAYYIALEKNLDPDKPRNLAKSVTVK